MDYREEWNKRLLSAKDGLIKQEGDKRGEEIWETWFKELRFKSYDSENNILMLKIPSVYIIYFIEEFYFKWLLNTVHDVFGKNTKLNYYVEQEKAQSEVKFSQSLLNTIPTFRVSNAKERLKEELKKLLGDEMKWLSAYDKVAEWLSDNKGRGLLCIGTGGLGKSIICCKVLPKILGCDIPVYTANNLGEHIDKALKERVVIIDDLGEESQAEVWIKDSYKKRKPFQELCDAAEKEGILLIISTNLSTTPIDDKRYPSSIKGKYGSKVLDRLRATTIPVLFEGESMRG